MIKSLYTQRLLALLFVALVFPISVSAEEKVNRKLEGKPEVLKCSCNKTSWQQAFDNANHVVFGEVKTVQKHGDELATGDFIPMETFKGDETHITKIVGSSKADVSCRRVLRAGFYIAYAGDSNTVVLNNCVSSRQLKPEEDLVQTLTELKNYSESKGNANSALAQNSGASQESPTESDDWVQMFIDWWESWSLFE